MVRSIFAAALLAVSALAIPLKNACDASKASLTLPAGLTTAAGAPSAVLLGVGVQNYTCTDAGTYTAAGAVAELYDISCLIGTPLFASSQDLAMGAWKMSRGGKAQDIVKQVLRSTSVFAGEHYFVTNPAGAGISPMWDQRNIGPKNPEAFVIGAKKAGVAAPVRPNAPKDVDWLEISNVQGKLATTIYRTDTREGVAPASCTPGSPLLSVKYTSKYWLYGSTL